VSGDDDRARHAAHARFVAEHAAWYRTEPGAIAVAVEAPAIGRIEAAVAERYAARGWPRDWAAVGLRYEDPYILLLRDAVTFPDGAPGIHHRILRRGADPSGVAALPLLDGRVALVRHFRHATRAWHWEAPRGAIEAGESAEQAAERELREEIGGETTAVAPLGRIHGSTAMLGMSVALVLAEMRSIGRPETAEGIAEVKLFAPETLKSMIRAGEITDAFTLGLVLHAQLADRL
jgi:ADP-ribose pyrophosphatase